MKYYEANVSFGQLETHFTSKYMNKDKENIWKVIKYIKPEEWNNIIDDIINEETTLPSANIIKKYIYAKKLKNRQNCNKCDGLGFISVFKTNKDIKATAFRCNCRMHGLSWEQIIERYPEAQKWDYNEEYRRMDDAGLISKRAKWIAEYMMKNHDPKKLIKTVVGK